MTTTIDKLTADGCRTDDKHKVCRSRGGESCAFDGAMIVLQPIKDAAHVVHGPIACCGNSWEGRGALAQPERPDDLPLPRMGFTTDMTEIDIVYGSEEKLYQAILRTAASVKPRAVFVYATCVSGLIGEDIDAVCARAQGSLGIPVIPVNAPGFVGPKNLGNRIAGEALLDHVIGTGEPPVQTHYDINLIGEYNIAGDLWMVEPLLAEAGMHVLSRMTGNAAFEEITWAHRAKLNVVVCGRALINVAREMERRYGIPFVEVSFFGRTEIANALRSMAAELTRSGGGSPGSGDIDIRENVERLIKSEEKKLHEALKPYGHLRGKRAVLYSGGVKSWSFISALRDLGIEAVAVGTKKSTFEDEEKMKALLGTDAPLVEDVTPKRLLQLLKERGADMLIAGGRNQYLAIKEGYPFVDVNQERHTAYAGYGGLVNLAGQISTGLRFYNDGHSNADRGSRIAGSEPKSAKRTCQSAIANPKSAVLIDPLKHSSAVGAAIAFQGLHNALPIIHGAQGCGFLGKVLLTKHFREPIALATTKLFVENVVMGSEDALVSTAEGFIDKNAPDIVGILTSGLCEVKGDDVAAAVQRIKGKGSGAAVVHVATPDYDGGLEKGYARAVEAVITASAERRVRSAEPDQINILAGSHLTPGDVNELREIVESFGMTAIVLPDLSALDGSRQGISPLSSGGTRMETIRSMGASAVTLAIGRSLEPAATMLKERAGVACQVLGGLSGLHATDTFMETLSRVSGRPVPEKYVRKRRVLVDGMRDAHALYGGKRVCLALEPDHAVQMSRWLTEMGAEVELAVIPTLSDAADLIEAHTIEIGDLFTVRGEFDVLISNSHAVDTAERLKVPLYQAGFPVSKVLGYPQKAMIGYLGTLAMINEVGNLMMKGH